MRNLFVLITVQQRVKYIDTLVPQEIILMLLAYSVYYIVLHYYII